MGQETKKWWKRLYLVGGIALVLGFVLATLQDNGLESNWGYLFMPLWLAFTWTMHKALVIGGREKINGESPFAGIKFLGTYDKLAGYFMVGIGYFVILMMLLGLCSFISVFMN